jgi:hypothetical protein
MQIRILKEQAKGGVEQMKGASRAITAALACAMLLFGCSGGPNKPVSGQVATPPAKTAKPPKTAKPLTTPTLSSMEPTATPFATSTPSDEPPSPYAFPIGAAGLFGSTQVPEGFTRPVWLSGDGRAFLFATKDNGIFRALWDGSGYAVAPIAENINTGASSNACLDDKGGTLFCEGSRANPNGGTVPCVVMVNLADGSRCNVDDYVGWKEENLVFSSAFQYFGGLVLSEMKENHGGKYASAGAWALADIERRAYTVLDMTGFREKNLPQWQEISAMKLALVGQNRLLAVCRTRGSTLAATGDAGSQDAQGYYAFLLDLNGNVLKSSVLTPDAKLQGGLAIFSGVCFNASPDGKYLLYGPAGAQGVYLFDVDKWTEKLIPGSAVANMAFTQWGKGGAIFYGLAGKAAGQQVTIYRTSVEEVLAAK